MPFIPDNASPTKPTTGFVPDSAEPSFMDNIKQQNAKLLQSRGLDPSKYPDVSPQDTQKMGASLLFAPGMGALSEGAGKLMQYGKAALQGGGASVGAMNPADSNEDKLAAFLKGGAIGAGSQGAGDAIIGTGRGVADSLMKKAVGIRKAPVGVGNTLVDEGLVGTKAGMLSQAEDKLGEREKDLQELVGQLKGNVDSKDIADAVMARGKKFVSPSRVTLKSVQPDLDKVTEAAGQFDPAVIGAQGPRQALAPQDLLSLKRQGDWAGYTASGNPASAMDSEIGRAVADKSRGLLSDMSNNGTAEVLAKEKALILAKKALNADPTTHMGVGSSLFFGKIPGQSVLGSVGAQAAQKLSGGVGSAVSNTGKFFRPEE